jgi:hypothetical protein
MLSLRTVLHDASVDGGMIDRDPTFLHEFFHMAIA